jgi:hypothetical protein
LGPNLQKSVEQKAAQAGTVSSGVGSAIKENYEKMNDDEKNR